ncbi:MAG: NUDIX domain-containing protein [Prolixibacteraceae bacterium]
MNNSFKHNIDEVIDIEDIAVFFNLLAAIEGGQYAPGKKLICRVSPGALKTLFGSMANVGAAGGLVTDPDGRFLFIRRFGRWDLPKGGIEKNESAREAAVREVIEECGLDKLEIIRELPSTLHLYRSRFLPYTNNWVLKKTSWFEMLHHGNGQVSPQTEEDIEEVRWFEKDELPEVLASTYANLKKMLCAYLDYTKM